jgi:hypothetical protein
MDNHMRNRIIETGDFAGEIRPAIHPITHSRQLFDVYRLTYECYLARGHYLPRLDGLWIPHPDFDHVAETTILVAELEGEIVGTVSITLDGTRGLPLDEKFKNTCMLIRSGGKRLAQVWRLLVKESCSLKDPILTSLVYEAVHHLLLRGIHTSLFFVQEQHAEPCRELLNAVTLTSALSAHGLSNARSILMRAETDNLKCVLPARKEGGADERTPHLTRRR